MSCCSNALWISVSRVLHEKWNSRSGVAVAVELSGVYPNDDELGIRHRAKYVNTYLLMSLNQRQPLQMQDYVRLMYR